MVALNASQHSGRMQRPATETPHLAAHPTPALAHWPQPPAAQLRELCSSLGDARPARHWHSRTRTRCAATPPEPVPLSQTAEASSSSQTADTPIADYSYTASDGTTQQKATLERVWGPLQRDAASRSDTDSSGTVGTYMTYQINERNLVWNDDLKVRLIKRVAAQQMGVSDEEMDWRLNQLANLLPGLVPTLLRAPPHLVARAAAHTEQIANRLLRLKIAFPSADLVRMVGNRLTLLLDDDIDSVEAASGTLREMLPGLNVDLFVSDYPLVLDTDVLATAIEDCKRLMPDKDPVLLLRANPNVVLSLVKGKHLLVYDQVKNPWT